LGRRRLTSSRYFGEVNAAGLTPVLPIRWQSTGKVGQIKALQRTRQGHRREPPAAMFARRTGSLIAYLDLHPLLSRYSASARRVVA